MILVDSSVWIDYFNGAHTLATQMLYQLMGYSPIAVGDLIVAEVLQGFSNDRSFEAAKRVLLSMDFIEVGGKDIAVQAARNYRALRERGVTIRKTIGTIIATRCIESGHILLHDDRDFDPFVKHLGLRVAIKNPPPS